MKRPTLILIAALAILAGGQLSTKAQLKTSSIRKEFSEDRVSPLINPEQYYLFWWNLEPKASFVMASIKRFPENSGDSIEIKDSKTISELRGFFMYTHPQHKVHIGAVEFYTITLIRRDGSSITVTTSDLHWDAGINSGFLTPGWKAYLAKLFASRAMKHGMQTSPAKAANSVSAPRQ